MYNIGQTIDNTKRGCGHLKAGGVYLSGSPGGGTLPLWVWLHSSLYENQIEDQTVRPHNYTLTCPARNMLLVQLRPSLELGQPVTDLSEPYPVYDNSPLLQRVPKYSLLDHVGMEYSPLTFAEEAMTRGVNRRIPMTLAKTLAPHLPMPITFTHNMALLTHPDFKVLSQHLVDFAAQWLTMEQVGNMHDPEMYDASHFSPGFGFNVRNSAFHPHMAAHFISRFSDSLRPAALNELIPAVMFKAGFRYREGAFGASWVSQAIYVMPEGDDPASHSDLLQAGIVPVFAGATGEGEKF